MLDPMTNDNPDASTFSIGGGLWFVLSGIVASLYVDDLHRRSGRRSVLRLGSVIGAVGNTAATAATAAAPAVANAVDDPMTNIEPTGPHHIGQRP